MLGYLKYYLEAYYGRPAGVVYLDTDRLERILIGYRFLRLIELCNVSPRIMKPPHSFSDPSPPSLVS